MEQEMARRLKIREEGFGILMGLIFLTLQRNRIVAGIYLLDSSV